MFYLVLWPQDVINTTTITKYRDIALREIDVNGLTTAAGRKTRGILSPPTVIGEGIKTAIITMWHVQKNAANDDN